MRLSRLAVRGAGRALRRDPGARGGRQERSGRFRLRAFPCREVQGNIWVFTGDASDPALLPAVPSVPGFDGIAPQVRACMRFPCASDVAAMGFFDPAHPAFVHTSRWWKAKALELAPRQAEGVRARRARLPHEAAPSAHGANPYRLLGRNVHVDVTIQLPGLRIEHIQGDRHSACVLAACTPIQPTRRTCITASTGPWGGWRR